MTTYAVVLSGGGVVGIAWEIGLLHGLQSAGVDLTKADLLVGTSAGSVVGTQVALGMPLPMMLALQTAPLDPNQELPIEFDPQIFGSVAQKLLLAPSATPELMTEIGTLALSAPTAPESAYLQRFAMLQSMPWPSRRLLITAVDTHDGSFKVWDREAGAPLAAAVASSCAVPGIFPPITINERRYMDGGMRSDTNADLAQGYDVVVIIKPIPPQMSSAGPNARQPWVQEVADLRAAGSRVEMITPDAATLEIFGPALNLMDVNQRISAAHAGTRQGEMLAPTLREVWA